MQLRFLGHACFEVGVGGKRLLFDPFLSGNPLAPVAPDQLDVDYILLTHGHGDHVGDTIAIARRTGAIVIAPFELASYCRQQGANVHEMHIGGAFMFPFGRVKLTPAWHGSAVVTDEQIIYTGNPCGYLIEAEGKVLYNAGDTGLFGDMRLIGERHRIDVALLPIGDNFTMGPDDAAYAARLLRARTVIPMHYDTFERIKQDPERFAAALRPEGIAVQILRPGETFTL
ncbi:MAG TPA: metal-dependent hydrolase [Limnochordia bacterium]